MKKIILRTGAYSLVVMTALYILTVLIGKSAGYDVQEVAGYAGIIVSLLFVYFGTRQYRDQVNNSLLTFGQGMKIGLLITLIPSFGFALLDIIYTTFINKSFYENYYKVYQEKMKASLSPDKYAAALEQLRSERAFFSNPLFMFAVMFLTVFLIGIIITVISALILRRNAPRPPVPRAQERTGSFQ
jgi:hypothetical protein